MCFLRSLHLPGWLKSSKMVEYEPLIWEGWREDATLFPTTEPNGFLNFDDFLQSKTSNEVAFDTECNDLNWLDEKVDLSVILQTPPTEEEYRLIDDAVNLLFDSSNIDYLSPDVNKNESNILDADVDGYKDKAASSNNYSLSSPCYDAISEASSPATSFTDKSDHLTSTGTFLSSPGQVVPADFCQSPSYCSTPGEQHLSDEFCQSPDFSCLLESPATSDAFSPAPSEFASNSIDEEVTIEPDVSVVIYDAGSADTLSSGEDLSIEEVTRSVRKRKFVSNGKEIPKIRVSLENVFHPYKKSEGRKPRNQNDRKKVQNKEAAARYRMKKKLEHCEIKGEVSTLESQQKELQKKHDSLVSEIKYLKSLMCEILQKKGVLK